MFYKMDDIKFKIAFSLKKPCAVAQGFFTPGIGVLKRFFKGEVAS